MTKYKYYLIDIDRTLWDFDKNSEAALHKLVRNHISIDRAVFLSEDSATDYLHRFFLKYEEVNNGLWREYESGRITKEVLRWKRFYDTFTLYGVDDISLSQICADEYLNLMICEKELVPGAMEMLQRIEASGGKMAVLSNGFKEVQYHKLSLSGIKHFFQAIIISEEIGYHKPSNDIFRIALEQLCGFSRESNLQGWKEAMDSTLMIGDDYENDIVGARNFGIDQYFFNYKHIPRLEATFISDSLEGVCSNKF